MEEKRQTTIEELLKDAHCSDNKTLVYKVPVNPRIASKKHLAYAGYCLVEAEKCPYYQRVGNASMCNNRYDSRKK